MTASEEIELAILGRLYRRITELADRARAEEEASIDQLRKTLRNGEYRGVITIATVLVDEFAQPILGRDKSVFDNDIFMGNTLL